MKDLFYLSLTPDELYGYDNPNEILEQIDPSLELINRLFPASAGVYLVKQNGQHYIFKTAHKGHEFVINNLETEIRILEKIKDNVKGVTHLIRSYDNPRIKYLSLLREYKKGTLPLEWNGEKQYEYLKETIRLIHEIGFVGLEIYPRNILKSVDGNPYIVDLGSGKFEQEVDKENFYKLKLEDLKNLDILFQRNVR